MKNKNPEIKSSVKSTNTTLFVEVTLSQTKTPENPEVAPSTSIQIEVDTNDVEKVFSKFGIVVKVEQLSPQSFIVKMDCPERAQKAMGFLNGHMISKECQAVLKVSEHVQTLIPQSTEPVVPSFNQVPVDTQPTYEYNNSQTWNMQGMDYSKPYYGGQYMDPMGMPYPGFGYDASAYNNCSSKSKFTCRFDIQIPNNNEFHVAKRIIGNKGCNMKQIIESAKATELAILNQMYPYQVHHTSNPVKLRLRGKGSGFKEGNKMQESNEPLHLCVSSHNYECYLEACKEVESLLARVYQEYVDYQTSHICMTKPEPKLKVKRAENNYAAMMRKNDYQYGYYGQN